MVYMYLYMYIVACVCLPLYQGEDCLGYSNLHDNACVSPKLCGHYAAASSQLVFLANFMSINGILLESDLLLLRWKTTVLFIGQL
jgi:hypothetical protein